jgi:hypothetical protein
MMTETESPPVLTQPETEAFVAKLDAWAATLSLGERLMLLRILVHAEASVSTEVQGFGGAAWENKLQTLHGDAQLANADLQNMLQKQQQTLQMMSNISKLLYDTATSVIRKMGG